MKKINFEPKCNRGYSLIVLVITMVVILIISGVAISSLSTSRERRDMMNFIYDLTTMEEKIQSFYVETGTLPTPNMEPLSVNDVAERLEKPQEFLTQISEYDNENYYIVDLNQISGLSLKQTFRGIDALKAANPVDNGYIVNEGSLRVYVEQGLVYQKTGEKTPTTYYTITNDLSNGNEKYTSLEEELIVVGNPQIWVKQAELRVILPKRSLQETDWDRNWVFKWDAGPKTKEQFDRIPPTDTKRNFKYGERLIVQSNGIYSIYVEDPDENVTIRNVVINKIDDIEPGYLFMDGGKRLNCFDNETGIKYIKFKKLSEYKNNLIQAQKEAQTGGDEHSESRTKVDYYLMDGLGNDVLYEFNKLIDQYIAGKNEIEAAINKEKNDYDRWIAEHPVDGVIVMIEDVNKKNAEHQGLVADFNRQMKELNTKYAYLYDLTGSNDDSRLVLYIEDYAGNGAVVGDEDFISTNVLSNSYYVDLTNLNKE